jgi:hypothetical protein
MFRHLPVFLLILIEILLVGCDKEKPGVNPETSASTWLTKAQFKGLAKIKMNSLVTVDHLFVYGPEYFSVINKSGRVVHNLTRLRYPAFHRLPVSEAYFVEAETPWLRFASSLNPVYDEAAAWVDIRTLSPDVKGINYGSKYPVSAIDINEKGQCLVPVYSNTATSTSEIILYLFTVAPDDDANVKVADIVRVTLSNLNSSNQFVYCAKGIKDYFIVSVDGATFKVYSDGQAKKVINTSVSNLFQYGDKLYALKQPDQLFISKTDGEAWEAYEGYPDALVLANYFVIADSIIATTQSDLYTVNLSGNKYAVKQLNKYAVKQLNNDGLETNEITSLSLFGDSVYVSTYSGVFVKHKNQFFEYKNVE